MPKCRTRSTPISTGRRHAACAAKTLAPFPSQGQEEKEVRQGQIHSDPGEAGLEDQGQNAGAECPAARPGVSKRKWETRRSLLAQVEGDCEASRGRRRRASPLPQDLC